MKLSLFNLLFMNCLLVISSVAFSVEEGAKSQQLAGIKIFSTEASFEDTKEDLLTAISDSGLVVSYTAHAQAMFDRTAAVTGQKIPVYDAAEIVLFCKADLSHDLVEENPHNLILCPYGIAIYVLHSEPERVYLSYREQTPGDTSSNPISRLLRDIIAEVL